MSFKASFVELEDGSLVMNTTQLKRHCCPECGKEGIIMFAPKQPIQYRGVCPHCDWNSGKYDNILDVEKLMPYKVPVQ